jgi:hypothetical protein
VAFYNCLACGEETVSGQRRQLGSQNESSRDVIEALRRIVLCKRFDDGFSVSTLYDQFVCVKCFNAYNSYAKKGK